MSKQVVLDTRHQLRYSEAFKREVIREIDSGRLTRTAARLHYGIAGHVTIERWHRRYSKFAGKGLAIRMITKTEQHQEYEQQERMRDLEHALADAHLRIRALDTLIDLAEETYHIPVRKNSGAKQSNGSTPSPRTEV
jgi:transposase-like protein